MPKETKDKITFVKRIINTFNYKGIFGYELFKAMTAYLLNY